MTEIIEWKEYDNTKTLIFVQYKIKTEEKKRGKIINIIFDKLHENIDEEDTNPLFDAHYIELNPIRKRKELTELEQGQKALIKSISGKTTIPYPFYPDMESLKSIKSITHKKIPEEQAIKIITTDIKNTGEAILPIDGNLYPVDDREHIESNVIVYSVSMEDSPLLLPGLLRRTKNQSKNIKINVHPGVLEDIEKRREKQRKEKEEADIYWEERRKILDAEIMRKHKETKEAIAKTAVKTKKTRKYWFWGGNKKYSRKSLNAPTLS